MEKISEESHVSENAITAGSTMEKVENLISTAIKFIALLLVAIFAPVLNMQALTGTIVNATLFVAVAVIGVPGAIMIGIIPSMISAITGLLPAAILPMVPFIIASNIILVMVFSAIRKSSYWKGMIAAAALKFIFLSSVSTFVITYFVPQKVASQVALMMSWPQLFTAITGGMLAYYAVRMKSEL